MNQTVGIRRAVPADAAALQELLDGCVGGSMDDVGRWLSAPDVYTYLSEVDHPFGTVTVGPHELDDRSGEVLAWVVAPGYQARGYGRKLLVHGMTVLKRRQYEKAAIWISVEAERAAVIGGQLGFEVVGAEKVINVSGGSRVFLLYEADLAQFF